MRTPTTVRITNPPMPGRATAASAHNEVISRSSSKRFGKNDSAPIGKALLGACGAIPDRADTRPSKITSSVGATLVALPPTGTPDTPAKGRTSGACDTRDPPAAADNPAPWMSPDPSSTDATPAMPNKKDERSDGGCVSGTTAPTTELAMYCPGAMTSNTGVSRLVTGATASVTGATASVTGATTLVTGATASVTGATASVTGATTLV